MDSMNPLAESYGHPFIEIDPRPFLNSSTAYLWRRAMSGPMHTVLMKNREIADNPDEDAPWWERRCYLARYFMVTVPPGPDGLATEEDKRRFGDVMNARVSRALIAGFMGKVLQFRIGERVAIWMSAHLIDSDVEKLPAALRAICYAEDAPPAPGLTDFADLGPLWPTPEGGSVPHPIPDANLVKMTDHPPVMVEIGSFTGQAQPWRSWDGTVIAVVGITERERRGDGYEGLAPERLVTFQTLDGKLHAMPEWKFRDGRFQPARNTVEPYRGDLKP